MNFIKNSSVYFLSRIYVSIHCFSKVLWILAFSLCLAASIFKVAKFCGIYLQHPLVININVIKERKLEFPAVTVCNLNRKRGSDPNLNGPIEEGEPLMFSERRDLFNCKNYKNSSIMSEAKSNYLKFLKEWYEMSEEERYAAGHLLPIFIHRCAFNGKTCSEEYLYKFSDFHYGNCITFNKKADNKKVLNSSDTGVENGLQLILELEDRLYMESTNTIGAKLIIHDPDEIPAPEEMGYLITPGFETTICLKQTIYKRLPSPYKDRCVDYKTGQGWLHRSKEFTRSKDECIRKCIQMRNFEQCGCIDPTFGIMRNFSSCDLSNETELCCLDDVLENMSQTGPTCNCPLPIRYVSYGEQLSKSLLIPTITDDCFMCSKYDFARVKIFYSSLETHVYEQQPRWQISEFLSILGNECGLWLGSSLVLFIEILDELFLFVKHIFSDYFFSLKQKIAF